MEFYDKKFGGDLKFSTFQHVSRHNKIMQIMKAEMEELRGNNRIRFLEGERFMHLSRTD